MCDFVCGTMLHANIILKMLSFGSKECTKELKLGIVALVFFITIR